MVSVLTEKKNRKAVIVNDDITQLCVLSGILKKNGYETVTCTDAKQALTLMNEGGIPDIIITDIQMPEIDGWQFIRMLKSNEYRDLNHVPILAISVVFKGDRAEEISREVGADGFVPAPIKASLLLEKVSEILDRKVRVDKKRVMLLNIHEENINDVTNAFGPETYDVAKLEFTVDIESIFKNYIPDIIVAEITGVNGLETSIFKDIKNFVPSVISVALLNKNVRQLPSQCLINGADACVFTPVESEYLTMVCQKVSKEKTIEKIEDLLQKQTFELRKSREKCKSIMNMIDDPIFICSSDRKIEYMNTSMKNLVGKDVTGEPCYRSIYKNDSICSDCRLNEALTHKVNYEKDIINVQRSFDVSCSPIFNECNTTSVIYVLRDITERKKLEEKYRESEKMKAIGQLAGGIAHDFNNILGGIMGHADVLRGHLWEKPELTKYTENIFDAVDRGADLVNALLIFAQKNKSIMKDVDINTIIEPLVRILKHTIDKRIKINEKVCNYPVIVKCDSSQIENVLLNVALNARDAMPDGGEIQFITEIINVGYDLDPENGSEVIPGQYVRIAIKDTGTGISPEIKNRIFEPFFTTREVGKGTGLGLASAYGTIEEHKGYIKVNSVPDVCTEFCIYLPLIDIVNVVDGS